MKILVIQQKMIGDVLTSSILFEALRTQYKEATLHYLINENTMMLWKIILSLTNLLSHPQKI